jgi:hypothetical protein
VPRTPLVVPGKRKRRAQLLRDPFSFTAETVVLGFAPQTNRATIAALISPKNDLSLVGSGRPRGNVLKTKIREIAYLA